ncbi:hypothetical protein KSS87_021196, partial [Heliosperma pusillum]
MQTMGNEARKTHCSHKELQCKQWVMKQGRLIVTQGVTMQQWVMKQGRLIVHTMELQCKQWVMKQGRLIVHTRS